MNGMIVLSFLPVVKDSLTTRSVPRTATVRKFRRTDADQDGRLTPSNSMGLKCPSEVRV
jgi:hypothetical protein